MAYDGCPTRAGSAYGTRMASSTCSGPPKRPFSDLRHAVYLTNSSSSGDMIRRPPWGHPFRAEEIRWYALLLPGRSRAGFVAFSILLRVAIANLHKSLSCGSSKPEAHAMSKIRSRIQCSHSKGQIFRLERLSKQTQFKRPWSLSLWTWLLQSRLSASAMGPQRVKHRG